MVGNGNHPLDSAHIDDVLLEEYVLGQLVPNQEAAVQQHLAQCAHCRARAAEYRAFCQQASDELRDELDQADPGPDLNFDQIASQWRKPRRQFNLRYRMQQLLPSTSLVLVVVLLLVAVWMLFPEDDAAALRRLDLADDYSGPPAMIAASSDAGLVVVRLDNRGAAVVKRLNYAKDVRNLQFAPDAVWVAFQEGRTLHILECDGERDIQIAVGGSAEWAWSPDGRLLAYTDGTGSLFVFDIAAQESRELVPADEGVWGRPVWSHDGAQIAYASVLPLPVTGEPVQRQGIWRVDPLTGYRVELARNSQADQTVLVPAAWANETANVLAWDVSAVAAGAAPSLYWIDSTAHHVAPIDGQSLASGMQLAWPVSVDEITFVIDRQRLYALNLADQSREMIADHVPWPETLAWAPNGAWMAYTVAGAAEGEGLYLFTLHEHALQRVRLPAGAVEKTAFWAGHEHLFVVRQPDGADHSELWLVSLTTGEAPQRIMTRLHLPGTDVHNGWRWGDVVATQMIPQN